MRSYIVHQLHQLVRALTACAMLTVLMPGTASAQYFGRNKVQYDRFDFRVFPTDHFRVHFYPAESLAVADAARMAERWYVRHNTTLKQEFAANPLIFYADPPDFQQSNVIEGEISQGTGGVTEGLRERVIMPLTGSYAETDHVLGHELVHVFQYRIAAASKGGLRSVENIPLWLIEGMAEYLSLGRNDPNTAMWLRDAVRRNDLPTVTQLTRDSRYFPYRYGQALWAYIGGTWGDDMVSKLFRAALAQGWEKGVASSLGMSIDSLSKQWHASVRDAYTSTIAARLAPDATGKPVALARSRGEQNISPAVSADGKYVAYFSSRGLFGIDLYVGEVATGKVIRQLTSVTRDAHFDALSFISSAGTWSADGSQLAYVVYNDGDHEIDIANARSGHTDRRIRVDGVTAMSDPAWSPDGKSIAFTGFRGGLSDLYLYDLATSTARQLTSDREAQLHPAWSPDSKTLAFATDAGTESNFDQLKPAPMRLALVDVDTRIVQLLPRLGSGKHINPQYSADGTQLYFVSDRDGVSNVYRMSLNGNNVSQITNVATGVSGITSLSPAISIARTTGALLYSVFDNQGYSIRALDPLPGTTSAVAQTTNETNTAGILPPADARAQTVSAYLADATSGLLSRGPTRAVPYGASLKLDGIAGPQIGLSTGSGYGTGVSGGISFSFSDQLGNHLLQTVVQGQGQIQDFGGQLMYLNRSHRWNWGVQGSHIPLASGFATYEGTTFDNGGAPVDGVIYTQIIQREFFDNAALVTQYPLSATRRIELSVGAQRVGFSARVDSLYAVGNTIIRETRNDLPGGSAIAFGTASAAFVGDYALFGFTSPIAGGRYRFEVTPNVGTISFATALADYRRYFFARPFTFAFRGMHFGRYGRDAANEQLRPLYVGQPYLVRGYDPNNFSASECQPAAGNNDCPQFSRLSGSRLGVLNAEFRIPLFGTKQFGLIPLSFLPVEVSPFVDAGFAWSSGDSYSFEFATNTVKRVPVFSAGLSTRVNLFGYATGEFYWAKPFQRPQRNWVFGFQLQPGW